MQITFEPSSNWLMSAAFVPRVYFVELSKWIVFSAFPLQTPLLESSLLILMRMPCQRPCFGPAAVFSVDWQRRWGGDNAPRKYRGQQNDCHFSPATPLFDYAVGWRAFVLVRTRSGNAWYGAKNVSLIPLPR